MSSSSGPKTKAAKAKKAAPAPQQQQQQQHAMFPPPHMMMMMPPPPYPQNGMQFPPPPNMMMMQQPGAYFPQPQFNPGQMPPPGMMFGMAPPAQPQKASATASAKSGAKKTKKLTKKDLEFAVYDQWNNSLTVLIDYIAGLKIKGQDDNIALVRMIVQKAAKSELVTMRRKPMEMVIEKLKPYKELIGNKDSALFTEHADGLGELKRLNIGTHWNSFTEDQQGKIWTQMQILFMTGEAFLDMDRDTLQATGAALVKIMPKKGQKGTAGIEAIADNLKNFLGIGGGEEGGEFDISALTSKLGAMGMPAAAADELKGILSQATTEEGGLDFSALMKLGQK